MCFKWAFICMPPPKASLKNFHDLSLLSDYWSSISIPKISGLTLSF